MSAYRQKEIAIVNDLSGYGRCSLTVAIPVLPAMRAQCCPIPTPILSNHAGFPVYFFDGYMEKMGEFIHKWKGLELIFDGIVNGFSGSEAQIKIVMDVIRRSGREDARVVIDSIMGDHGETYATYTLAMCSRMKELASMGDIVTSNLTEACIPTGWAYRKDRWSREGPGQLAGEIQVMGPRCVVITDMNQGGYIMNMVAEGEQTAFPRIRYVDHERPGTGDVFFSVTLVAVVRGWSLDGVVRLAASLVKTCIARSEKPGTPTANGMCFEELMDVLVRVVDKRHEAGKLVHTVDSRCEVGRQA